MCSNWSKIKTENIIGLSREEIGDRFLTLGCKSFVVDSWHWLYHKGAASFEEMTTLSKKVRRNWPDILNKTTNGQRKTN